MRVAFLCLACACATAPRVGLAVTDQFGMEASPLRAAEAALSEQLQRAGVQPAGGEADYVVTGVAVSHPHRGHTCVLALTLQVREVASGRILGTPAVTEAAAGHDDRACALDGAKRAAASIAPRVVELLRGR